MILLSTLFSALMMCLAVRLLVRGESIPSLRPMLIISLAVCILTFLALRFVGAWGIGLVLATLIFALIHWCLLSIGQAICVALVWLVSQVLFGLFVSPIF